jgi:hypothetical protein
LERGVREGEDSLVRVEVGGARRTAGHGGWILVRAGGGPPNEHRGRRCPNS